MGIDTGAQRLDGSRRRPSSFSEAPSPASRPLAAWARPRLQLGDTHVDVRLEFPAAPEGESSAGFRQRMVENARLVGDLVASEVSSGVHRGLRTAIKDAARSS